MWNMRESGREGGRECSGKRERERERERAAGCFCGFFLVPSPELRRRRVDAITSTMIRIEAETEKQGVIECRGMRRKNRIFCRRDAHKRHTIKERDTQRHPENEERRERGVHDAHQWQQGL